MKMKDVNVGDEFTLGKRTYNVLKIYYKKYPEKDLILCLDNFGSKECFQRWDLENYVSEATNFKQYSPSLNEKIKELLKGLNTKYVTCEQRSKIIKQIYNESDLKNMKRIQTSIIHAANRLGIKLERLTLSVPVEQLDENGNVIRYFKTSKEAMNLLNLDNKKLKAICLQHYKNPPYNLRYAKEEKKKW